ncbi:tetratricopeptide repeat protein [Chryseobacterium chendengshani]|uniref:tetratricopeptide repeat protein n=1 Tax=Chryseobacterium sp. LJ668 TaxID=2864040 RepID=UPI001C690DAA|nr:tetratricopeptide repeat protein [Chryseobacterium sp. LJ668]MBW8523214.1 tetratricopeptide repeat protein [Chryseobacterium sp. LJ668]QYK15508.1 tetratricopeptide repeat protein [Chryseobacterium sp. LJ668]
MTKKILFSMIILICNLIFLKAQQSFKLADKEFDKGNYEKAIFYYTESINKKEELSTAYNYRGLSYLYLEKIQEAKADLESSFNLNPSDNKIHISFARFYASTGQFPKALEFYNSSIEKKPDDYQLYNERAGIKAVMEMYNEAIADADFSLKHLPNDYSAYLNRGYVYLRMGNYEKAINDLSASLKIKPSHKGFGNRGTAYALSKKYDLAINDFDRALTYNPDDVLVLYQKGEVLLTSGKREKACDCFLKVKKLGNNEIDDVIEKAKCTSL